MTLARSKVILSVIVLLGLSRAALADVDWNYVWQEVSLKAGDDQGCPIVEIEAKTRVVSDETCRVDELTVTIRGIRYECPTKHIDDLQFPRLETARVEFSSAEDEAASTFVLVFEFGAEPITGTRDRYPSVRIRHNEDGWGSREFVIPTPDGGQKYRTHFP